MRRTGLLLGLAWLAMTLTAYADNTACAGAIYIVPDGAEHSGAIAAGFERRWYTFEAKANRSYVINVENMMPLDVVGVLGLWNLQTDCAGAALSARSTFDMEPLNGTDSTGGDRRSFITAANITVRFSVGETVPATFRIRVEETTLFSNWFFVGGDYSAYSLLRNTTSSQVSYEIRWRSGAGAVVGAQTGFLQPHGSVYLNGRDVAGALAAVSGTVEVVHDGTVDAIVASTTVMSPSTGLSFDAPFVKRVTR